MTWKNYIEYFTQKKEKALYVQSFTMIQTQKAIYFRKNYERFSSQEHEIIWLLFTAIPER